QSTPRAAGEKWPVSFMHDQAREVLPALFDAPGIDPARDRPVLCGRSDGGSIALRYAAMQPHHVGGVIAAAPHIFVADSSIASIELARRAYLESGLRARLARYHADVDSAFWGWNDIWLDPAFRAWDIRTDLPRIRCPVLALQGLDDEYGTLEQIRGIKRALPHAQLMELGDCGHSPHKDQPDQVITAVAGFVDSLNRPG